MKKYTLLFSFVLFTILLLQTSTVRAADSSPKAEERTQVHEKNIQLRNDFKQKKDAVMKENSQEGTDLKNKIMNEKKTLKDAGKLDTSDEKKAFHDKVKQEKSALHIQNKSEREQLKGERKTMINIIKNNWATVIAKWHGQK